MHIRNRIYVLVVVGVCGLVQAGPVSVPVGHPVYEFLDRMETRGLVPVLRDAAKPFDRKQVAGILKDLAQKRDQLTGIDQDRLDNFLVDFRPEIQSEEPYPRFTENRNWYSPFAGWSQLKRDLKRLTQMQQPEEENHVFAWEDSSHSLYVNLSQTGVAETRSDNTLRMAYEQHRRFRGTIAEKFGYGFDFALVVVNGDSVYRNAYPALKGYRHRGNSRTVSLDRSTAEIAYQSRFFNPRLAHQSVIWGQGESGQLILSDHVEPYPYLGASKSWSWGNFTFLHGKLLAYLQSDSVGAKPYGPDKWVAGHRLDFTLWSRLGIGISELVVYGERYADWGYLIPFNFYSATQNSLGDRDNKALALDVDALVMPGLKLYGTLFLDDLHKQRLMTGYFGNKYAFLLGCHIADPFGLSNLLFCTEYTAIMPWVYTHHYDGNRYISNTRSLGHWSGPNSEVVYGHLSKAWHYRFKSGIKVWQRRHGANEVNRNVGGDILVGHDKLLGSQAGQVIYREFLDGIQTIERNAKAYFVYETLNGLFLDFAVTWQRTKIQSQTNKLTEVHVGLTFDY